MLEIAFKTVEVFYRLDYALRVMPLRGTNLVELTLQKWWFSSGNP
jgi:hypothetical protein